MGDQGKTQPVGFLTRRNVGAPPAPVENTGLSGAAPVPDSSLPPANASQKLPSVMNIPAAPSAPPTAHRGLPAGGKLPHFSSNPP